LESLLKFDTHLKKIITTRKFIDQIITSRPVFIKFLNKKYNIKTIYLLDSDINQIILDEKDAMVINLDKFTIIKR
jgi:ribonucleotide monophosphatase NagD (HAD superfamily)